jgi:hypothetical protein
VLCVGSAVVGSAVVGSGGVGVVEDGLGDVVAVPLVAVAVG